MSNTTTTHSPAPVPHVPSDSTPPTGPHYPTPTPTLTMAMDGNDNGNDKEAATAAAAARDFAQTVHYIAVGTVIAAPALLILPPRKLDLYTFAVAASGVVAGNHLVRERNAGAGVLTLAGRRMGWEQRQQEQQQHGEQQGHDAGRHASILPQRIEIDHRARGGLVDGRSGSRGGEREGGRGGGEGGGVLAALHAVEARADRALDRWSLPTEKSRRAHDVHAAECDEEEARARIAARLAEHARDLREHGWGYGGDLSAWLQATTTATTTTTTTTVDQQEREGADRGKGSSSSWLSSLLSPLSSPSSSSRHDRDSRHGQALASALQTTVSGGGVSSSSSSESDGRQHEGTGGEGEGEGEGGVQGIAKKIWMGDETEGWKERRMREEQEALDEGRGYGSMILDQIWEVWNWDKRKNEDGEWVSKHEVEKSSTQ